MKTYQSGVALISVLLVFALATVIASEVISRNYRDIRRTANTINTKQAYHYAIGGEQLARQILFRDYIDDIDIVDKKTDTLADVWSQKFDTFSIENGKMSINIVDLQGLFNLNNLRLTDDHDNRRAISQFRELLNVLNIQTDYTARLLDWLDKDNKALSGGAEDSDYQSREGGYLAANREMSDRSELRLLQDMRVDDYNKLKDYVVALPTGTTYNLNTLNYNIVDALSGRVDAAKANNIKNLQLDGGFKSVSQWLSNNDASSLASIKDDLSVQSEYFEVTVETVYAERIRIIRTQLFRDRESGEMSVLKRQQGIE